MYGTGFVISEALVVDSIVSGTGNNRISCGVVEEEGAGCFFRAMRKGVEISPYCMQYGGKGMPRIKEPECPSCKGWGNVQWPSPKVLPCGTMAGLRKQIKVCFTVSSFVP